MSRSILRAPSSGGVTLSRISASAAPTRPRWTLAVFAHNESGRIQAALRSIATAAGGQDVTVVVLANGCTDTTREEVRACASLLPDLWLADIALADKANAWNTFVHELIAPEGMGELETCFFMDGDVTLRPDALVLLAAALAGHPGATAAGGMPAGGRDKAAWRERMVRNGTLAGNLYALRGRFVADVRQRAIRMPVGLIGEDLFLSWLVASQLGRPRPEDGAQCIFCANAEFAFRSLSPFRVSDYRTYLRRKWRYTRRALQLEMLMHVLNRGGIGAMPADVDELYATAPLPSRLRWVGLDSPMRLLAVLHIRSFRRSRAASVPTSLPPVR
jgi:hypothetical protein